MGAQGFQVNRTLVETDVGKALDQQKGDPATVRTVDTCIVWDPANPIVLDLLIAGNAPTRMNESEAYWRERLERHHPNRIAVCHDDGIDSKSQWFFRKNRRMHTADYDSCTLRFSLFHNAVTLRAILCRCRCRRYCLVLRHSPQIAAALHRPAMALKRVLWESLRQ